MNFCGNCGNKLVDGACAPCTTAKSTNGLSMETLEKSIAALEDFAKGVRPAEAKKGEGDERTAKEMVEDAKEQAHKYGAKGEGDSEEQPKTKRGVESAAKGGFVPPDEEEMEGDGDEDDAQCPPAAPPAMKSAKKAKKSFAEEALANESVSKAVDVSDFLETIVIQLGEYTDALRGDVNKSIQFAGYQQKFNVGLAKALGELGTIVKSLNEKLDTIGKAPATVRKSDQNVATIEKSFVGGDAKTNNTLTKSQIASKLFDLMSKGDNEITEADVVRAESSGAVRAELRSKLGLDAQ